MQSLKIACLMLSILCKAYTADSYVPKCVPTWAKLDSVSDRELILRVIGERWQEVVPFL